MEYLYYIVYTGNSKILLNYTSIHYTRYYEIQKNILIYFFLLFIN